MAFSFSSRLAVKEQLVKYRGPNRIQNVSTILYESTNQIRWWIYFAMISEQTSSVIFLIRIAATWLTD